MKKIICMIALCGALLSSCSSLYIQTVSIKSAEASSSDVYKYSDGNVTINYNFWAENGNPGFIVENNTDQMVYVNLSKSFYVNGNTAKDYFLNRTYSSSNSLGTSVDASVSGSAYGTWIPSGILGSLTKSIGKAVTKNSSKGVSYEEKPIVAIPAHCNKVISEYCIQNVPFEDCSVKMFPNSKGDMYSYNNGNMPEFSNIITYRVGENGTDKTIRNRFLITGFSNKKYNDAVKKEKAGCKGTYTIKTYKGADPMSFYIIYDDKTSNRNSADAKNEPGL